jgi:hypothetical protein
MPSDSLGPKLTRWLRSEKPWDDAMGREFESPHLHYQEQVTDLLLCFLETSSRRSRSVLGPCWVRNGVRVGLLEPLELVGEQVPIPVQRHRRRGVAEGAWTALTLAPGR